VVVVLNAAFVEISFAKQKKQIPARLEGSFGGKHPNAKKGEPELFYSSNENRRYFFNGQ
jgi:hypothetical protein